MKLLACSGGNSLDLFPILIPLVAGLGPLIGLGLGLSIELGLGLSIGLGLGLAMVETRSTSCRS